MATRGEIVEEHGGMTAFAINEVFKAAGEIAWRIKYPKSKVEGSEGEPTFEELRDEIERALIRVYKAAKHDARSERMRGVR